MVIVYSYHVNVYLNVIPYLLLLKVMDFLMVNEILDLIKREKDWKTSDILSGTEVAGYKYN